MTSRAKYQRRLRTQTARHHPRARSVRRTGERLAGLAYSVTYTPGSLNAKWLSKRKTARSKRA